MGSLFALLIVLNLQAITVIGTVFGWRKNKFSIFAMFAVAATIISGVNTYLLLEISGFFNR